MPLGQLPDPLPVKKEVQEEENKKLNFGWLVGKSPWLCLKKRLGDFLFIYFTHFLFKYFETCIVISSEKLNFRATKIYKTDTNIDFRPILTRG